MTFFVVAGVVGLSVYFVSLIRDQFAQDPARDPKRMLIPPWFDRLEMAMRTQGIDGRVVVDVTPMKARVLLRGVSKTSSLEDALGEPTNAVINARERLRAHGPIKLEDGVLVTTLDRNRVDDWKDDGIETYAHDCAVVAQALVSRRKPVEVRDVPAEPMIEEPQSKPVHEAEGAPSGAPVAVPFESRER